jgi:hypothetical protein
MRFGFSMGACARSTAFCALAMAAGLAAVSVAEAQTITTVAGKVQDQFSVQPNGAVSYRIPLVIPPDNPPLHLELGYSGRGSGSMGLGWGLRGLSAVTRCPRTIAQDGVRGAVRFDDNDRYCLDGQRLILVSGTYGQDGAEYRTELEIFTKVVSHGRKGSGPQWFQAWTKAGQIMEYGNGGHTVWNPSAPQGTTAPWVGGTIREWDLNKISDVTGNFATFDYDSPLAPRTIAYGGNSVKGTSASTTLQFTNSSVATPVTRYLAGAQLTVDKKLTEIDAVQTPGSTSVTVGKTVLAYAQVGAPQTPRLSSVQVCGTNINQCLPTVNLAYSDANGGFATSGTSWALPSGAVAPTVGASTSQQTVTFVDTFEYGTVAAPQSRTQTQISLIDLNGDGLPDLYLTGYTPPSGGNAEAIVPGVVYFNTGTGFATTATPWPLPAGIKAQKDIVAGKTVVTLVDLNGDGLPDLYKTVGPFVAGNPRGEVYFNTGSGFATTSVPWGLPTAAATSNVVPANGATQVSVIDMDGDGLPDVYVTDGTNAATVYLNTGSGYSTTAKAWPLPTGPNGASSAVVGVLTQQQVYTYNDTTQYGTSAAPLTRVQTHIALVDLNGDGLPDLYITAYNPTLNSVRPGIVYFNTGNGFLPSYAAWPLPSDVKVQKDVVQGQTLVTLIDLNGDGLPDLYRTLGPLGTGNPRGEVFFNTGNGFAATSVPWSLPVNAPTSNVVATNGATQTSLIDIDGDGFPDVYVTDGVNPAQVYLSNSPPLSRLSQISSLIAPTTTISYSKLTDPTVYTKDSGANATAYPWVDIAAAKTVVASVATDNGIGGTNTATYKYGGLKTELGSGRGVLGFRWMDAVDSATGLETYTEYRQDFPYIGQPLKSELRLAGSGQGGVLKRTTNTLACQIPLTLAACTIAVGNGYFTYLASSLAESWDLNGAQFPSVTTTTTYGQIPQYGYATQVVTSNGDGFSKTVTNEYWPADTTKWIFGRVKRTTVTSTQQ